MYEHRNLDNRVLCCTRTVYVVQSWLDSCTHCQPMPILADLVQNFVCSMHVHVQCIYDYHNIAVSDRNSQLVGQLALLACLQLSIGTHARISLSHPPTHTHTHAHTHTHTHTHTVGECQCTGPMTWWTWFRREFLRSTESRYG